MTAALAGSPAPGLLLQRGCELAALRAAIGEAVGGRARVVLVFAAQAREVAAPVGATQTRLSGL